MWRVVLELCADAFGATNRDRPWPALVAFVAALALTVVMMVRFGPQGIAPVALLAVMMALAARDVFGARDALWRASALRLDDPRQHPAWHGDESFTAPTAVALHKLATAVDAARRGRFMEASDGLRVVERALLRPSELALLEAVRALVSLGLGDASRAAEHAAGAVPTGSDDLDAHLGRVLVTNAWGDAARLATLDRAWSSAGVGVDLDGGLGRLRRLMRIRIEGTGRHRLADGEALRLADEARAIGDDDLAAELEADARRSTAYR